jgi:hypothetical protein
VTLPGPGTWTLSVWLTNAAGYTNPGNAAHTTLAAISSVTGTGESQSTGTTNAGSGSNTNNGHGQSSTGTMRAKLTATLHKRRLIVRVSGPSNGNARITYTIRYRGKTISHGTKTAVLKRGRLTVSFLLTTRAMKRGTIRLQARLANDLDLITTRRLRSLIRS